MLIKNIILYICINIKTNMMDNIQELKTEFYQNRYDDKDFAECYNKDEFWHWIKDYKIRIT